MQPLQPEQSKVAACSAGSELNEVPPIVNAVLDSPGQPLHAQMRGVMEPHFGSAKGAIVNRPAQAASSPGLRIGHPGDSCEREADRVADQLPSTLPQQVASDSARYDLSPVRIHTDPLASKSAQAVNALAFTVGHDIVFGAGQYSPESDGGRRLLAHELTHVVQQSAGIGVQLQRTQSVTIRRPGHPSMTVITGGLSFAKDAKEDVLRYGALLPSADQQHIGFHGNLLGYDPAYTDPTEPFRWNKLKELIDSDAKIFIKKVGILGPIRVLFITPKGRTIIDDLMRQLGLTLPTEALNKQIYPNETTMTVSPDPDVHHVLYTTALGTPADSSLAHELFGHMWLAIKGVPYVHPKQPAEIAARGTLSAQNGILTPFGDTYTGTVQDYIDKFVGSESGMLASPTQNVGSQLLQQAILSFKNGFVTAATGTLNGPWKVPPNANSQWEIVSSNHALAQSSATAKPAAPQTPPSAQSPASPSAGPTPAQPASSIISQASIEQDLIAWYGTLNADKQYVFIKFLEYIQISFGRRTQLTSTLLNRLSRPQGMAPPLPPVP